MVYGNQFKVYLRTTNMKRLINSTNRLKSSDISRVVKLKYKEFRKLGKQSNDEIFKELCFCLLTANYSAMGGIKIQNTMNNEFLFLTEKQLAKRLADLGHRFPNARAKYIYNARKKKDDLELNRDWLIKNIKGLGMKESSHFLRNIGFDDYAIIDFHIIDLLVKHDMIERPNSLTKNKYLEIETKLKILAEKTNITLSELDMYLWYIETGKILK